MASARPPAAQGEQPPVSHAVGRHATFSSRRARAWFATMLVEQDEVGDVVGAAGGDDVLDHVVAAVDLL